MDGQKQVFFIFYGQRGTYRIFLAQQIGGIDTLEIRSVVRLNRPSLGIVCQGNLGQFVLNTILFTLILTWQVISETETIVEHTEHHLHQAACMLPIVDCQFVIMVTGCLILAPGLSPCLVLRRTADLTHGHVGTQFLMIKTKTKMRGSDECTSLIVDCVERTMILHTDGHHHGSVG